MLLELSKERNHKGTAVYQLKSSAQIKDGKMKVLCTGGCGFVGSVLVSRLANAGHLVTVWDLQWFGNHIPAGVEYTLEAQDFATGNPEGFDAIIHLAAVANDPTGDLDPKLTWATNALGTAQLAAAAAKAGVKQFIYASSGSVYGISDLPQVTEDAPLVPVSEYNKTKAVAERIVLSYADKMAVQILRPATVCGYSPRIRLDVVVNALTMQALTTGTINVLGGDQYRPNLHVEDMADAYLWMLERPNLTGIYNVGFENMKVMKIAEMVAERTGAEIFQKASVDPRSYRLNSDRLMATGFLPKRSVKMAIAEMQQKFNTGELQDLDEWVNIKGMRQAGAA